MLEVMRLTYDEAIIYDTLCMYSAVGTHIVDIEQTVFISGIILIWLKSSIICVEFFKCIQKKIQCKKNQEDNYAE
jgi:hypothetical protein